MLKIELSKDIFEVFKALESLGATPLIVGGAVRDSFLNLPTKDIDIEVYNIDSYEGLAEVLSSFGDINLVGRSFGVIKLKLGGVEYDFSLPRREKKVSKGHRGFDIELDSSLNFKEAFIRRDFTINAIGYNPLTQEIIDPFNGVKDLKNSTLRVVNRDSFLEDPLRVYRAVQFVARFNLNLTNSSFNLMREMVERGDLEELPKERIFEEFKKLLLKAKKPSIGFKLLRELGIIKKYFFELDRLIGVPQDSIYHAEGDVWNHTLMVIDEMAKLRTKDSKRDLVLLFGAVAHDFGKPDTTKVIDGKVTAVGHEKAGVKPTIDFLKRLTESRGLIEGVSKLVQYHAEPLRIYRSRPADAKIRRLSTVVNIRDIEALARADYFGRASKIMEDRFEAGDWLLKRAKELGVLDSPPKPIILGRDLIKYLNLSPSPQFKDILEKSYRAQLDGAFSTKSEALKFIKDNILKDKEVL